MYIVISISRPYHLLMDLGREWLRVIITSIIVFVVRETNTGKGSIYTSMANYLCSKLVADTS